MKLTQILLELDKRTENYPGIKPDESVKGYKARMANAKSSKSAANKKYREYQKSFAWHVEDFNTRLSIVGKLPKVKNEMFAESETDVEKHAASIMDYIYPVTKKLSSKLKAPVFFTKRSSVKYWLLEDELFEDCLGSLNKEIKDYMDDNMTESQKEALISESTTYDIIAQEMLINE